MKYGNIKLFDVANGLGCRVSLFVSGCTHHCLGCFNQESWDFNYGTEYTKITEDFIVEQLKFPLMTGLSLLGGEPFEYENETALLPLVQRVKGKLPSKDIWCYTGYTFEELKDRPMMQYIDILVDGEFQLDKRNIMLQFRGSENQRIIDVRKSLESGTVVLWESDYADKRLNI